MSPLYKLCQYHPTSQFLVVTPELSQIHPSLDYRAETQRLGPEALWLVRTWPKPGLTNYSSSRCVRPMTVSLASWARNFPSLWATAGQRKETDHIKTRLQSITEAKSLETSHYHVTAELQSQSSLHFLWTVTGGGGGSFPGMESKNHCTFTTSKQCVLPVNFHFLFALHLVLL